MNLLRNMTAWIYYHINPPVCGIATIPFLCSAHTNQPFLQNPHTNSSQFGTLKFFFCLKTLLTLAPELSSDSQSSTNSSSASPYIYLAWRECMHMNSAQCLIPSSRVGSFLVKVAEILCTANLSSCLCRFFGLLPNPPNNW